MALPVPWPGLLALVDRASSFAPDPYGVALAEASGSARSAVCALVGRGTTRDDVNLEELGEHGWLAAQRALGNRVGVWWQLVADDPNPQADEFARVILALEARAKVAPGTVFAMVEDENQGVPELAPMFAAAFRARQPQRQAAVVPLGLGFLGGDGVWYPAAVNLHAWQRAGFRDYPECYRDGMVATDVHGCLLAHRLVFDAALIRPLLSAPELEQGGPAAQLEGVLAARADGATWKGLGVFPGERLAPAGWRLLGAAARTASLIA